jgi:hypothetical protein
MVNAFALHLPVLMRRLGGSATPYFSIFQGQRNCRFSINFLRIPCFFERGALHRIIAFARHTLRAFAPSREVNLTATRVLRGQGVHAKARRPRRKVAPHFHIFTSTRNCRLSLNFLRNPRFFKKGTLHKIITSRAPVPRPD